MEGLFGWTVVVRPDRHEHPGVHSASCTATDNAGNSASATLTYVGEATDQFVYVWKLDKRGTGDVTVSASVAYPGSSTTSSRTELITITG